MKKNEERLRIDDKRKFFTQRVLRQWSCCPVKLWMSQRCSKAPSEVGWGNGQPAPVGSKSGSLD